LGFAKAGLHYLGDFHNSLQLLGKSVQYASLLKLQKQLSIFFVR
jgi:hypothetical protein